MKEVNHDLQRTHNLYFAHNAWGYCYAKTYSTFNTYSYRYYLLQTFPKKVYSSDMMDDRSTTLIKTAYPEDHYLLFPFLNSKEYEVLYNYNRYNSKLTFRFNSVVRAAYEKYKKDFEYKQTIKLQDLDTLDATINGITSYIVINCYPKDTKIVTQYFTSEKYKEIFEELQDFTVFNDNFVNLVLVSYRQFKEIYEEKNKQRK